MNITDFRRQYPQYGGLPDGDIAGRLYAQYFSTMDENDFLRRFMGPVPDSVFGVDRPAYSMTTDLDPTDVGTPPEPLMGQNDLPSLADLPSTQAPVDRTAILEDFDSFMPPARSAMELLNQRLPDPVIPDTPEISMIRALPGMAT